MLPDDTPPAMIFGGTCSGGTAHRRPAAGPLAGRLWRAAPAHATRARWLVGHMCRAAPDLFLICGPTTAAISTPASSRTFARVQLHDWMSSRFKSKQTALLRSPNYRKRDLPHIQLGENVLGQTCGPKAPGDRTAECHINRGPLSTLVQRFHGRKGAPGHVAKQPSAPPQPTAAVPRKPAQRSRASWGASPAATAARPAAG